MAGRINRHQLAVEHEVRRRELRDRCGHARIITCQVLRVA
jgi:hypothetical protein